MNMQSLKKLIRKGTRTLRRSRGDLHTPDDETVQPTAPVQNVLAVQNHDYYLDWLSWANAGMLFRGNHCSFDHAIKHLKDDAPILEIGSFCGLSTNVLNYYRRLNGRNNRLFTCDPWKFEGAEPGRMLGKFSSVTHDEYREFVRESFLRNVRLFSRDDLPHTIEAPSADFFTAWRRHSEVTDVFGRKVTLGGQIGFVYIDGCHAYADAKVDFHLTDEFLEPGGFVLFDNSADGSSWEVCRVIEEVKATGRYEVAIANPNYLFRKLRGAAE